MARALLVAALLASAQAMVGREPATEAAVRAAAGVSAIAAARLAREDVWRMATNSMALSLESDFTSPKVVKLAERELRASTVFDEIILEAEAPPDSSVTPFAAVSADSSRTAALWPWRLGDGVLLAAMVAALWTARARRAAWNAARAARRAHAATLIQSRLRGRFNRRHFLEFRKRCDRIVCANNWFLRRHASATVIQRTWRFTLYMDMGATPAQAHAEVLAWRYHHCAALLQRAVRAFLAQRRSSTNSVGTTSSGCSTTPHLRPAYPGRSALEAAVEVATEQGGPFGSAQLKTARQRRKRGGRAKAAPTAPVQAGAKSPAAVRLLPFSGSFTESVFGTGSDSVFSYMLPMPDFPEEKLKPLAESVLKWALFIESDHPGTAAPCLQWRMPSKPSWRPSRRPSSAVSGRPMRRSDGRHSCASLGLTSSACTCLAAWWRWATRTLCSRRSPAPSPNTYHHPES